MLEFKCAIFNFKKKIYDGLKDLRFIYLFFYLFDNFI